MSFLANRFRRTQLQRRACYAAWAYGSMPTLAIVALVSRMAAQIVGAQN